MEFLSVQKQAQDEERKKKSLLREYIEAAILAIFLAFFIRTFVVQAFKIPSSSMEPTLLVGDHILVNKFIYGIKIPFTDKSIFPISSPKREDVVVFIYPIDPDKDFIKRVIGVPGDTIEIKDQRIYINGSLYSDTYGVYSDLRPASSESQSNTTIINVPADQLFVMGDNRDHSYDSRFWGFVPIQSLKGKAFIVYWSWPNWQRFFHWIN